jgi:hypothetical protein
MKQVDFYNKIQDTIEEKAVSKNPEGLANAIYFLLKQYAPNLKIGKEWAGIMKEIKEKLSSDEYGWSMVSIHEFFVTLFNLTKYIRKFT